MMENRAFPPAENKTLCMCKERINLKVEEVSPTPKGSCLLGRMRAALNRPLSGPRESNSRR